MCINLSSPCNVRAENAVHVNLCLCLSFQTQISALKNGVMRMMLVMGTWCFCSKTSSRLKGGARFEVGDGGEGEALPYLAHTGQLCAAEHKVLRINQGVELYYFNSKNLIIYFIVLIVKFYFNSKFA